MTREQHIPTSDELKGACLKPLRSTQSVNHQIDQIAKAAQRIKAERDIFEAALYEILRGRYFFGDRPRAIANDAITEAARL